MFTKFRRYQAAVGFLILLTLATKSARAVDPRAPATSYARTTFSVEDGLSSNVVNAILQTRNGFLWIGTDAGLNRFNGRHFTPIFFRGTKSTPQGIVSALAEGPDGDLWIGTSAGLVRISRLALDQFDQSLSVFYHPGAGLSDEITCLHFSRDGELWVGTGAGLYRFDGKRFEAAIPNASISRIEESANGHMFIISGQGFIELDGKRVVENPGLANQLGIRPDAFFHVFEDREGVVWFCTSAGLARRVNGLIERFQHYGTGGQGVYRVYEDPQGSLWVLRPTGIFRVSGTTLEPLAPNIPLRPAPTVDREGNLWIGTNGEGLMRFKDRPIRTFTKADGLPNDIPMTVIFYVLLRPVSRDLSLLAALFGMLQTAVLCANKLNLIMVLLLLGGSPSLKAFDPNQLQALASLSLTLHEDGFGVGLIFFGVSCLVTAFLMFRSGYFPRVLGLMQGMAGVCYLTNSFAQILFPHVADNVFRAIVFPAFIGEFATCLYLIVRGLNISNCEERVRMGPVIDGPIGG